MPAVKTGFTPPPMPGMPAPMQPMGGMPPAPGMGGGMPPAPAPNPFMPQPPAPLAGQMPQGQPQMMGSNANRRRKFGDALEGMLGRNQQGLGATLQGQAQLPVGQRMVPSMMPRNQMVAPGTPMMRTPTARPMAMGGEVDIFGYADGGAVQYFSNGGLSTIEKNLVEKHGWSDAGGGRVYTPGGLLYDHEAGDTYSDRLVSGLSADQMGDTAATQYMAPPDERLSVGSTLQIQETPGGRYQVVDTSGDKITFSDIYSGNYDPEFQKKYADYLGENSKYGGSGFSYTDKDAAMALLKKYGYEYGGDYVAPVAEVVQPVDEVVAQPVDEVVVQQPVTTITGSESGPGTAVTIGGNLGTGTYRADPVDPSEINPIDYTKFTGDVGKFAGSPEESALFGPKINIPQSVSQYMTDPVTGGLTTSYGPEMVATSPIGAIKLPARPVSIDIFDWLSSPTYGSMYSGIEPINKRDGGIVQHYENAGLVKSVNYFDPETKTYTIAAGGDPDTAVQYSYGQTYDDPTTESVEDYPADVAYSKRVQENRAAMGLPADETSAWELYKRGEHYSQRKRPASTSVDSVAMVANPEVVVDDVVSAPVSSITGSQSGSGSAVGAGGNFGTGSYTADAVDPSEINPIDYSQFTGDVGKFAGSAEENALFGPKINIPTSVSQYMTDPETGGLTTSYGPEMVATSPIGAIKLPARPVSIDIFDWLSSPTYGTMYSGIEPVEMRGGGSVPREAMIANEPHMLAYINQDEEALLRSFGGSGISGPGGIPSYPPDSAINRDYGYTSNGFSAADATADDDKPSKNAGQSSIGPSGYTSLDAIANAAVQADDDTSFSYGGQSFDNIFDYHDAIFGGDDDSLGSVNTSAKDADLAVGGSDKTVTADDLTSGEGTTTYNTGGGGSVTVATGSTIDDILSSASSDDDSSSVINVIDPVSVAPPPVYTDRFGREYSSQAEADAADRAYAAQMALYGSGQEGFRRFAGVASGMTSDPEEDMRLAARAYPTYLENFNEGREINIFDPAPFTYTGIGGIGANPESGGLGITPAPVVDPDAATVQEDANFVSNRAGLLDSSSLEGQPAISLDAPVRTGTPSAFPSGRSEADIFQPPQEADVDATKEALMNAVKQRVSEVEGTADEGGYDRLLGQSEKNKFSNQKPLSEMTVAEAVEFGTSDDYRNYSKLLLGRGADELPSTPMGKYQILGSTLEDLVKRGVVDPNAKFDAATQEMLGSYLIENRGLFDTDKSREDFVTSLGQEFEGIQKSGYDGTTAGQLSQGLGATQPATSGESEAERMKRIYGLEARGLGSDDDPRRANLAVNAAEAKYLQNLLKAVDDPNILEQIIGQIGSNLTLGMVDFNKLTRDQAQKVLDAYRDTGSFVYDTEGNAIDLQTVEDLEKLEALSAGEGQQPAVIGVRDGEGEIVSSGSSVANTVSGPEVVNIFEDESSTDDDSGETKNYTMGSDGTIVCNDEGYVYNPETDTCEPPAEKSDTVSSPIATGGQMRSFEDILAGITTPAPKIAPISANIRPMQAGGMVRLNRAADNFIKALAG